MKLRELEEEEKNASTDAEKAKVATERAVFEAGQKMQEEQLAQFEEIIKDTEEVVVGLNADPSSKQLFLEVATLFVEGSKIDKQLARSANVKTTLSGIHRPGEAISLSSADVIDPSQIAQMKQNITTLLDTLKEQLAKDSDAPKGLGEAVDEFKTTALATIEEGIVDTTTSISLTPALSIVSASHVSDGNKVASAFQKLDGAIKNLPQAPKIQFNASNYKGAVIHLGTFKLPDDADPKVKEVLGETVNFAIGTASKKRIPINRRCC